MIASRADPRVGDQRRRPLEMTALRRIEHTVLRIVVHGSAHLGHTLAVRHLGIEDFPDGAIQLIDRRLLREQDRAPRIDDRSARLFTGLDRKTNDDGLRPPGLDARHRFNAVFLRHVEIHDDQGWAQLLHQFDRFFSIRTFAYDQDVPYDSSKLRRPWRTIV
jgi:hypothetical protein